MVRIFCSLTVLLAISFTTFSAYSSEQNYAFNKLMQNVSPAGAASGAVIASPSRHDPDYFFHWVRDGALVMDVVLKKLQAHPNNTHYKKLLFDYINFSQVNQIHYSPVSLGEPKYYVDGRPYDGPWGRPQNDGPALRALVLTRLAMHLIKNGETEYVRQKLYDSHWPTISVVKRDLEYVANYWQAPSFDLWEEVKGQHFYTRMAQRTALLEGADLAELLSDQQSAEIFRAHARAISYQLSHHFQTNAPYIVENLNRVEGLHYKNSGLDTATILAVLHTYGSYNALRLDNDFLLNTIYNLEQSFISTYPINQANNLYVGVAFGRYPEDLYFGGNPWFLTTLAIAEHHFRLVDEMDHLNNIQITAFSKRFFENLTGIKMDLQTSATVTAKSPLFYKIRKALVSKAHAYLNRVRTHRGSDQSLWEQMDKHNGYMVSAKDLTWSYAALITALQAEQVISKK